MSTTHLLAFFFGAAGSPSSAHAPARKLVIKPKRRKYTFPNGITVWATSEAMARLVAGVDAASDTPGERTESDSTQSGVEASLGNPPEASDAPVEAQTAPGARSEANDREIDYSAAVAQHNAAALRHKLDAAIAATVREAEAAREAAALGERMRAEAERKAQALRAEAERKARVLRMQRMRADEEAIIMQLLMEDA